LFRTVKYSWLDDHNQKELCDELTIRTYVYKLKTPTFDNLKKLFNNWIVLADKLYRVSAAQNNRKVFFPCRALSTAQVWVEKTAIGEKDDCGNVKIIKNVDAVFSCNPSLTSGTTGGTASTIDNPAIIKINDTQYARLSETSLVDLTGLEPQTPYSWGGFELLGEDPSNYDAFMDFANAKSQFIAKKGDLQETQTGKDLENAIKDSSGKYDIRAITDKKEWTDRLAKLIIKAPSEWHYSDDKYTTLTDNIGALNPEEIKKLIKSLAFWDELKGKDVFKESALTPPFSSDAVDGKEIWSFHPITFIQQMSLLMKAGLTPQQNLDFETLVSVIRAALGTNSTDSDGCKAIAVSFSNRLKKHEWIDSPNFQSLAARHQLKTQTPTEDEFNFITENVSRIFMDHKWSGLPDEYVLFHATSEALSSMPWDTGVLDIDNPKTVGSYKFYRYKPSARTFATVLIIKDIKLVNGGDKGVSLMCVPGAVVSSNDGSTVKPYRYDLKTPPRWDFEFRFNIDNCTPEMDDIKSTLKWELRYFHKNNDKYEEVKVAIAHTGYKFTVILPADISDYSVTLVPAVNDTDVLCDGFTIAIKKKEQLVFNGTTIKWLDENGGVVPFENGTNKINELNAFSGNSGKRAKEFQCVINEGPIPEGSWWVPRNNIRSYDKVNWWGRLTDTSWEGGENRWGKLRLLLEPALNTDTKNRSGFYICGSNSQASHGNIHLDAQMIVFANSFLARVESNGRLLLCVDYSKPRFVPPSKHLPWEIKERTVRLIAGSESGSHPYTACNYDGEFEGKFNPKDVRYSKFSDHPRHVGLSFGLIQFTQEGSLGELIALMNTRDPQLFKQIFGVHSEELLEVTSRKGNALYVNEEIFDNNGVSLGEKSVKRQPSVQPIAGHELWNSFWSEKLIVAGKQEIFQQCQIELAVRSYMDNCLQEIVGKIISEKSLALAYDRSVNEGPGVGGRLIKKCAEGDEKCFWTNYIPTRSDKPDIHRRLTNIYNSQDFTWEAVHEDKA
jgi:hypothetical protein